MALRGVEELRWSLFCNAHRGKLGDFMLGNAETRENLGGAATRLTEAEVWYLVYYARL